MLVRHRVLIVKKTPAQGGVPCICERNERVKFWAKSKGLDTCFNEAIPDHIQVVITKKHTLNQTAAADAKVWYQRKQFSRCFSRLCLFAVTNTNSSRIPKSFYQRSGSLRDA
jgi:hypothetical protein